MTETRTKPKPGTGRTIKVLLPVDGSRFSEHAADHLVKLYRTQGALDIHVLNVQVPIDSGHARMFATNAEIQDYHHDEGMKVLKPVLERLEAQDVPYTYHVLVGGTAAAIVRFAEEGEFDKIVMGTHGRSGLTHLLLGSVAEDVLKHSKIPVVLVK